MDKTPFAEGDCDMENETLLSLFEQDKDMVMSEIARDRSPAAAQAVAEKAIDRVLYRHAEHCGDPAVRESAQIILRTIKSALPLMDSVGEVHRWQKTVGADSKPKPSPLAWAALALGAVLVVSAMLGLMLSGGRLLGIVVLVEALLPVAAGMALLFWAGMRFASPKKARSRGGEESSAVREEFLVDSEKLWHHLRGMMLLADGMLDSVRARAASQRQAEAAGTSALPAGQAELFAGILENAYGQQTADAKEMIEAIRFYLHSTQVEVVDYAKGREAWFEFLPAMRPGTIRPALVSGEKLLKKGLASE